MCPVDGMRQLVDMAGLLWHLFEKGLRGLVLGEKVFVWGVISIEPLVLGKVGQLCCYLLASCLGRPAIEYGFGDTFYIERGEPCWRLGCTGL